MADLTDFNNYVTQVKAATVYKNWANSNATDAQRWNAYSQAILAGQTPAPPPMLTAFGKSLVLVGIIALNASGTVSDGYGDGYFGQADFGE